MSEIFLEPEEIQEIFKTHLKIESKVMAIETLFANIRMQSKIIYNPYYQRNYVWDNDKATYFIESILLGTEIPPLVFFNTGKNIEVIDGRQRFETIKRFIDNQFHLTQNGLVTLKSLNKLNFNDLSPEVKDVFFDTKLRIIEFSVVNEPRLDERSEDLIKKEIFRRYNSGITPLRNEEIENALYIHDDTTKFFKQKFKEKKSDYELVLKLFFLERDMNFKDNRNTLDRVMQKIRLFLVLHNIPIRYYSNLKGRKEIVGKLFENLSNNTENPEVLYNSFINKMYILRDIDNTFDRYNKPTNRLVYECVFWALSILENEHVNLNVFQNPDFKDKLVEYLSVNMDKYHTEHSHFYKEFNERYISTANFFETELSTSFNIYLSNNGQFKVDELSDESNDIDEYTEFQNLRLNKTDSSTTTIEDICRQMLRERFLVRPPYQRGEAINKLKSSAIIESILLGIKLPPIFVYKRIDGISEVVDGQQRILSILGFIGEDYLDENMRRVKSEKNKYALSKLAILDELDGKNFDDLPEQLKDKIYDFNLSIVTIDAKVNPSFNPIDLFIRLNNKPYPIRENTFEMWNSYIDKDIISLTKDNTKKHSSWFYSRINNNRMENEELYITLAYLEYKKMESVEDCSDVSGFLDIYQRGDNINFRIKEKTEITKVLNLASTHEKTKVDFLNTIKSVESFIKKLKTILIDKDVEDSNEYLKNELDRIFNIRGRSSSKRTLQSFYALWYILKEINFEMIKLHRIQIKKEINEIIVYMKNLPSNESDSLDDFKKKVVCFWDKYKVNNRSIVLSYQEKQALIKKQNNICPLCGGYLFVSDDINIDHIKPLAVGGRDSFLNLQATHKQCNLKKKASYNM